MSDLDTADWEAWRSLPATPCFICGVLTTARALPLDGIPLSCCYRCWAGEPNVEMDRAEPLLNRDERIYRDAPSVHGAHHHYRHSTPAQISQTAKERAVMGWRKRRLNLQD